MRTPDGEEQLILAEIVSFNPSSNKYPLAIYKIMLEKYFASFSIVYLLVPYYLLVNCDEQKKRYMRTTYGQILVVVNDRYSSFTWTMSSWVISKKTEKAGDLKVLDENLCLKQMRFFSENSDLACRIGACFCVVQKSKGKPKSRSRGEHEKNCDVILFGLLPSHMTRTSRLPRVQPAFALASSAGYFWPKELT